VPPLDPPQPATIKPTKTNSDAMTKAGRRFRIGATHSNNVIRAVAAAPVQRSQRVPGRTLFVGIKGMPAAAVVLTVSIAVPVVVVPVKLIGPPTEHVGESTAPAGDDVTLHDSATAPANPPVPVAVMVEVPD
jgi:hypothetical protein